MENKSPVAHREDVESAHSQQYDAHPDGAATVIDYVPSFRFTFKLAMLMVVRHVPALAPNAALTICLTLLF